MIQLRTHGCYIFKYTKITRIYAYTKRIYLQSNMFRPTYICKLIHTLKYTHTCTLLVTYYFNILVTTQPSH